MTTLYIVSYDIPSDKRRTKVYKTLSGFGQWTQYSVFELYLSDKELVALQHRLECLLDPEEDNLRMYHICESCRKKAETVGSPEPQEPTLFIM